MSTAWQGVQLPVAIQALAQAGGLSVTLARPPLVRTCQRLLHDVYHDELGWRPESDNPSRLRIEGGEAPAFVDDYDADALWIAVCDGEAVVATTRVLMLGSKPLELALYHPLPPALVEGAMEVNRLAIAPAHRRGHVLAVLACTLAWIARRAAMKRAIIAVQEPISRRLFRPLQWQYTGITFRYHPGDHHACEVLSMQASGLNLLLGLAKTMATRVRNLAARRAAAILGAGYLMSSVGQGKIERSHHE